MPAARDQERLSEDLYIELFLRGPAHRPTPNHFWTNLNHYMAHLFLHRKTPIKE